MDILAVSLFVTMEVALLLGLTVAVFKRSNTRLKQQIHALQQSEEKTQPGFESIASGYLPYLEKQIIDTRARLELHETESGDDELLENALIDRLAFLSAEKKVAESSNDYPERHWEHVVEHFTVEQAEQSGPVEEADGGDSAAVADQPDMLPAQVSVAELAGALGQQGDALTTLRTLFEQVKQQPDEQAIEKLELQLKELEHRYSEANTCVEIMEQENQRLQARMEKEERHMQAQMEQDTIEFQQQISKQNKSITDLHKMVGNLQLEAEKAAELKAKLEQFDNNAREMNLCIEIMEEENEFLRDQVQALLQLDQDDGKQDDSKQIESLQAELLEKENKLAELEARYASMEREYLTLYEENNAGKKAG